MIIGLDISTSITGITILNREGEVILNEAWDTRKYKNFFAKAEHIYKQLKAINYPIDRIYIEQSLQAFRPGFSSAKTILTLAKFNGIVSYVCDRIYQIQPEYIGASSARKLCGIKVERGKKAKQVVLDFLLDNEPSFRVQYTKQGNPKPGVYDRADALIVARAGLALWNKKS